MARQPFQIQTGDRKPTSVLFGAVSLANTNITVDINGSQFACDMSTGYAAGAGGTDGGQNPLYYMGTVELTGLTPNTQYSYTATQGVNVKSGITHTSPGMNDDWSEWLVSCDNRESGGGDRLGIIPTIVNGTGVPVKAIGVTHIDDIFYGENKPVNDRASLNGNDSQDVWFQETNGARFHTIAPEYSFSANYLLYWGLLGSEDLLVDSAQGQDPVRQSYYANFPRQVVPGDHELWNNTGEYSNTPGSISSSLRTGARDAWLRACAYANTAPHDSADSTAWSKTVGCVQFIAVDRLAFANKDSFDVAAGAMNVNPAGEQDILGATQITNILNSFDPNVPFHVLLLPLDTRYPVDQTTLRSYRGAGYTTVQCGAQQPLGDNNPSEYSALLLSTGAQKGLQKLCDESNTNWIWVSGDTHHHRVRVMGKLGGAGETDERYMKMNTGSLCNSAEHPIHPDLSGYPNRGLDNTIIYQPTDLITTAGGGGAPIRNGLIRMDVFGSANPKYIDFVLMGGEWGHVNGIANTGKSYRWTEGTQIPLENPMSLKSGSSPLIEVNLPLTAAN